MSKNANSRNDVHRSTVFNIPINLYKYSKFGKKEKENSTERTTKKSIKKIQKCIRFPYTNRMQSIIFPTLTIFKRSNHFSFCFPLKCFKSIYTLPVGTDVFLLKQSSATKTIATTSEFDTQINEHCQPIGTSILEDNVAIEESALNPLDLSCPKRALLSDITNNELCSVVSNCFTKPTDIQSTSNSLLSGYESVSINEYTVEHFSNKQSENNTFKDIIKEDMYIDVDTLYEKRSHFFINEEYNCIHRAWHQQLSYSFQHDYNNAKLNDANGYKYFIDNNTNTELITFEQIYRDDNKSNEITLPYAHGPPFLNPNIEQFDNISNSTEDCSLESLLTLSVDDFLLKDLEDLSAYL